MKFPRELVVPPQSKPIRLDAFLVNYFPKTSRSFWKKNLQKLVQLNHQQLKKGGFLKGGEILSFLTEWNESLQADPKLKIKIILEDSNFLVVEKPPGIAVHPLSADEKGTLIQGVLAQFPEIASIGNSPLEGGLAHRLDNETSGLLLIARTQKAYQFFREEFKKRKVEKEYWALVVGKVDEKKLPLTGKIDLPIIHHPKNKKKMRVVEKQFSNIKKQVAITLFSVEKSFQNFTLLKVRILTGVRHQIRTHLAYIGFPIVGDELYGGEKVSFKNFDRIFLHAAKLKFKDPIKNNWIECHSSLSNDLRSFLKTAS